MIPGPSGPQGIQGTQGIQGLTGPQGQIGLPGFDGNDGEDSMIPGPSGPQGTQGIQGLTGPQGQIGLPGFDGNDGEDSMIPGPSGPQGIQGLTGPQGPMGFAMDGDPGDDPLVPGPQGPQGIQGIQGLTGAQGPASPMWLNTDEASVVDEPISFKAAIFPADLPGSFSGFANPSGLVGLAAVNGAATTATRSDATHALDQAIAPTWTGTHLFNALPTSLATTAGVSPGVPAPGRAGIYLVDTTSANADEHVWNWLTATLGTQLIWRVNNDAGNGANNFLVVTRALNAVASMQFGNATNNPSYTILGSGLFSIGANVQAGVTARQSSAYISARAGGASFEFGHSNSAGYGSTIGANAGDGRPFLAFHAEPGTTINTYKTRGIVGRMIQSDLLGGVVFGRAATANADNQSLTQDLAISASGNVTIAAPSAGVALTVNGFSTGAKTIISTAGGTADFCYTANGQTSGRAIYNWSIAGTDKAYMGLNNGAGDLIVGSAAGDFVLRTNGTAIDISADSGSHIALQILAANAGIVANPLTTFNGGTTGIVDAYIYSACGGL